MDENPYELLYLSHIDETAQMALFSKYMPLVISVSTQYLVPGSPILQYRDDLIQEGRIAVRYAMETYRFDRGTSFLTYVTILVQRRIWSVCRRLIHLIRSGTDNNPVSLESSVMEEAPLYNSISNPAGLADPEYYLHYADAAERLKHVFQEMNEKERMVADCWMQRISYSEAAEKLHMSHAEYDGRLQKVKKKIKAAVMNKSRYARRH